MWERGLKYGKSITIENYIESLPMWERGLKSVLLPFRLLCKKVAPHVGAWIEMSKNGTVYFIEPVAPHVGAWIEIFGKARKNDDARRSPCGSVD